MKKTKKILSALLCMGMCVSAFGGVSANAAETTGSYTMYYGDNAESEIYQTGTYDITAPVALDTSITKEGSVFAGWDMEATYDEEKYFKKEEKILGEDEAMKDGVDYYVKTEVYSPLSCYLINGITPQVITDESLKNEILSESECSNLNSISLMIVGDDLTDATLYAYYYDLASIVLFKKVGTASLTFDISNNAITNPKLTCNGSEYTPNSVSRYSAWSKKGSGEVVNLIKYPALKNAATELFGTAYICGSTDSAKNPTLTDGENYYLDVYSCRVAGGDVWTAAIEAIGIPAIVSDTNVTSYGYQYYYPVTYNSSSMSSLNPYFFSLDKISSNMISSKPSISNGTPVYFKDETKSAKTPVDSKDEANGKTIYYVGKTEILKEEYIANKDSSDYIAESEEITYTEKNVTTTPTTLYKTVNYYPHWIEYITQFNIKKSYLDKYSTSTPQEGITPGANTLQEEISFTVTPFKSFNREVGKNDIPEFSETSYTIAADDGDDSVNISLPDFTSSGVGDYWYEVKENTGSTAGVDYDESTYYMHIVVTRESSDSIGVTQVTLHKEKPDDDGTYKNQEDDKTDSFTNKFASGSLTVKKSIKGNMADPNKLFKVTITFNAPTGETVKGDIKYSGGFTEDGTAILDEKIPANWSGTKVIEVYLKSDSSIEFTNIPDGVSYSVAEADYSSDNYQMPSFEFDNEESGDTVSKSNSTWADNTANGTISDEADTVEITNTKESSIDVGLNVDYVPYIVLIGIALACGSLLFFKKRYEE